MNKIAIILNVLVLCFLFSCNSSRKDGGLMNSKDLSPSDSVNGSNDHYYIDTTGFNNLNDIITYFNKKTDSMDKVRVWAFKNQKNKSASYKDSIHAIESIYYGLFEKRNEYILKYLTENEKNSNNMNGLIYLVVDKKIPYLLIDSIYKQFPEKLRNLPNNKLFITKIEERKKTEIISSYDLALLNIKLENLDGEQISLNEINSKAYSS